MEKKKGFLLAFTSVTALAMFAVLAFSQNKISLFDKIANSTSEPKSMDITAEQLETAMSGSGNFTLGSYDNWKAENVTFFTDGGVRYAKLDSSSVIYSANSSGSDGTNDLKGAGYTGVTFFNKKANATSYVYLLDESGGILAGEEGTYEVTSGNADEESIQFTRKFYKRLKFGGVEGEGNYIAFSSIKLHYTCEQVEAYQYKNDGVYIWKEAIPGGNVFEKQFIEWELGAPLNGFRTDVSTNEKATRTVSIWDGSAVSTSLSGTGLEGDPYLIQSAADLKFFSNDVLGGNNYSGKFVKMTVSVDLNNNTLFLAGYSHSFAGTFDGNHNAILNNHMTLDGTVDGSANCIGLFRTVGNNSVIKKLIHDGTAHVGAKQHVGGFVGMANKVTIEECYNFVDVTGSQWNYGGFIGNNLNAETIIRNSANFASLSSTGSAGTELINVGGFVGTSTSGITINNCSNFGTISAQGAVAGIAGQAKGTISNCVNLGEIKASGTLGLVGDFVGKDGGVTVTNSTAGDYASYISNNKKVEHVWSIGKAVNGNRIDMNSFAGYRKVSVWDGSSKSESLSGTGTSGDPYLIQSANDLAYFANQVSAQNIYADQYVEMTVSVDLNNHPLVIGGYDSSVSFAGSFDGNHNFILGLSLSNSNGANGSGNVVGLFATLAYNATIGQLAVDGSVSGTTNVGAFVGITNSKSINKCYNFADVTTSGQFCGGFAGNSYHAGAAIVECYNFGEITSTYNSDNADIGGIIGRLVGLVNQCENYATINGKKFCGGIVGQLVNGTINNSINYGAIDVPTTCAGIVGDGYGTISNCVNYGTVSAASGYAGGIVGTQRNGAITISGCTNRGIVNGAGYTGGIVGAIVTNNTTNTFSDCANYANITGTTYVGGILGGKVTWIANGVSNFTDCSNNGTIYGTNYVGGIGGSCIGTYSNCSNVGTIDCSGANKGDLFGGGTMNEA